MLSRFFQGIVFALVAVAFVSMPPIARAMQLEPAITDLRGEAGQEIKSQFILTNDEARPQVYYFSIQKFLPSGEEGQQQFLPLADTEGFPKWTYLSQASLTLLPGERRTVPFVIKIPQGTPAGSVQEVIFASTAAPTQANGVSVGMRTGILLFLTIGTPEHGIIRLTNVEELSRRWFALPDVQFSVTLKNEGSLYEIPRGSLVVRGLFGRERVRLPFNEKGSRVLGNSSRRFPLSWDLQRGLQRQNPVAEDGFWAKVRQEFRNGFIGSYQLSLEFMNPKVLQTVPLMTVWIWPTHLLLVLGVFLILVSIVVFFVRRRPASPFSY